MSSRDAVKQAAYQPDPIPTDYHGPSPAYQARVAGANVALDETVANTTYILAGATSSSVFFIDDIIRVWVDGELIVDTFGSDSGVGPFRFQARPGQTIRIQGEDYYGHCRGFYTPFILYVEGTTSQQVLDPQGQPDGCGDFPARFIFYDQTYTIDIPSGRIQIEDFAPNPESFEPQASPDSGANTTTRITAKVSKTEMPSATGNYTLTIKPKIEEPPPAGKLAMQALDANPPPFPSPPGPVVRKFTGTLNFTGDIAIVNETWDGKSDSNGYFPDGACTIDLSVTVNAAGRGPRTQQGFAQVTVAGGARVDFLQDNQPVSVVRPSYLWHVNQGEDLRIPSGPPDPRNEPGWQWGFPSVVEVRATLKSQPAGKTFPYNVKLIATPLPDLFREAGHAHDGTGGLWPPGLLLNHFPLDSEQRTLNDQVMSTLATNTTIDLTIQGVNQPASAWWVAPVASGGVRFSFEAGSGFGGVTKDLPIRVEGLTELLPALRDQGVHVFPSSKPEVMSQDTQEVLLCGAVPKHPDNHWCTPAFSQRLAQLARNYFQLTKRCVWYNDTSLRYGGKFDDGADAQQGDLTRPNAHYEHRFGDIVDANTLTLFRQQGQLIIRDKDFEQAARKERLGIYWEVDHYHLRLRRGQ